MRNQGLLIIVFLLTSLISIAQLTAKVDAAISKVEPKCIQWRETIHQNPELGNNEVKTAALITAHLKTLGIEVKEHVGKTGVVGILKGGKPGPCIALRADMDALPVTEKVDIAFASKVKTMYNGAEVGVMHACGHDTHVAMLMSVAEVLASMKSELKGTIKFIFQPSEEGPPAGEEGGAMLMIKEGVMENPKVDVIYGLHIESAIPVGTIEYKSGPFMAASDEFTIKVLGKGSHGSQPWLGVDPIVVSAEIIQGLQTIVSRESELTTAPVIITVGKITSGVRFNVIPDEATMLGTIRTLDQSAHDKIYDKIRRKVENIAAASGAKVQVDFAQKTNVTYNDPELVKKTVPWIQNAIGAVNVKERTWVTGGEDFSYYGAKAPAFFFYLGGMPKTMDPKNAPAHHTSEFYVENEGMKTGIKAFCQIVLAYNNLK